METLWKLRHISHGYNDSNNSRNSKEAADEFKIERIHGSCDETDSGQLKQRSLVFRISKRSGKSIKNNIHKEDTLAISNSSTLADKNIPETKTQNSIPYSNVEEEQGESKNQSSSTENCNELIQRASPLNIKFIANESSELRRTSRRIVLRVNKDFIGTDCIKMGRRKKCRKSVPLILKKPDAVRRGPGRPRLNGPKPAMKPPKIPREMDEGTVWTLVPKEIIDSEYFKSQIIQVHYPKETSRQSKFVTLPPKTVPRSKLPRTPFQNRENFDLRDHHFPADAKQVFNQGPEKNHNCSSRPTVIYFKSPKNYSNRGNANSVSKEPLDSNGYFKPTEDLPAKTVWLIDYLRRKYANTINESELAYIYGVSGGDLRKTEALLSDVLSGKKLLITENDGQLRITNTLNYPFQILQVNENENRCDKICQSSANNKTSVIPDVKTTKEYPDTLSRQVIIDSIKMLYDENSVLGYT